MNWPKSIYVGNHVWFGQNAMIFKGSKIADNIYKISSLVEKPEITEAPSNLAIVGRYVLTPDIFDKISQTESGFNGEIPVADNWMVFTVLNSTVKVFNIETRLEWLKSSINFAMADVVFRDDLIGYMKSFI